MIAERCSESNADVADGGISQGTRSDEIRPTIRPWPLPPLRPKRAASSVASLRYGSGQLKTNQVIQMQPDAKAAIWKNKYRIVRDRLPNESVIFMAGPPPRIFPNLGEPSWATALLLTAQT